MPSPQGRRNAQTQVCERSVAIAGADIADIRTATAATGPQLTGIVLRLYRQTGPKLRSRCLDLIDRLEEVGAYGISHALEDER